MSRWLAALFLVPWFGCADDGLDDADGALRDGSAEAVGVLRFLNSPAADVATLDDGAALDARAARNIVGHVRGPDSLLGTGDDDLLETMAELDAIPQVGPATIARLLTYVESIGGVPRIQIEGVWLTAAEAAAIVAAANGASLAELDDDAGLDARAARGLVERRPHADLAAVAAVPYVATAALERLRRWAPTWSAPTEVTCHPGLRAGMRACVEAQVADGASLADAELACGDAEALGPVFDAVCAGPLGAPFCGLPFETFYTVHVPPCVAALADELAGLCVGDADCGGAPRRCWGTVNDGSTQLGVCQDLRSVPGQGDPCSATRACGAGLVCAGLSLWPDGICVSAWMTGSFTMDVPQVIAASAGATATAAVIVHGLATVPLDVWVDLDVRGVDPRRLRVWLENPQGQRASLWDGATDGGTIPARLLPRPGVAHDEYVNGAWRVGVETTAAGTAGTLHAVTVHVTSQWD
ncbi:MAG: hypothetical protein KBG48_34675 [Kofleriaceae bacterium]|nr:hypothetical protein [Kofleriaceae bacterium]MBP9172558.1 hypothetical protein [Kofleriaceae bacterium]